MCETHEMLLNFTMSLQMKLNFEKGTIMRFLSVENGKEVGSSTEIEEGKSSEMRS